MAPWKNRTSRYISFFPPNYILLGANTNTLRSSALELCYSVAEYCCPVWQRSTHVSLVDAQLHSSMRLISSSNRSTPLPWLPVLTNIEPPALQCRAATDKLITQAECHRDWSLYDDVFHISSTSPGIAQTTVDEFADNWCHKSVEGTLAIGYGGQFLFSGTGRPHNPTSQFWSSQTSMVTAESFSDRAGPL